MFQVIFHKIESRFSRDGNFFCLTLLSLPNLKNISALVYYSGQVIQGYFEIFPDFQEDGSGGKVRGSGISQVKVGWDETAIVTSVPFRSHDTNTLQYYFNIFNVKLILSFGDKNALKFKIHKQQNLSKLEIENAKTITQIYFQRTQVFNNDKLSNYAKGKQKFQTQQIKLVGSF